MDLQADGAALEAAGVLIFIADDLDAVDGHAKRAGLDVPQHLRLVPLMRIGLRMRDVLARRAAFAWTVIPHAAVRRNHKHAVAVAKVGAAFAPEADAQMVRLADEPRLENEAEIAEIPVGEQQLAARLVGDAANRAVLDRPEHGIARPSFQRHAVEQLDPRAGLLRGGRHLKVQQVEHGGERERGIWA